MLLPLPRPVRPERRSGLSFSRTLILTADAALRFE